MVPLLTLLSSKPGMIKIALVDDHIILRKSLAVLIDMLEEFEVVFQADNGRHCMEQLDKNPLPDIILLDITMPIMGGVQTAALIKQVYPTIKILALTMISSEQVILPMLKNGVRGYLLKDCETAELKTALREIHEHGYYYNELITRKMRRNDPTIGKMLLNDREIAFLKWACTDLTHKQIADEMKVSHRTIDGYRDSLFKKLHVNSRVGIAIYAIKHGLVRL
jgi:two-component system, NarL family, invasion response regulator UvrY